MRYRLGAIVFFMLVGVLELGDFAGNVSTLADEARLSDAAQFLGVSADGQRIRLTFLLPLTGLIAALSLSIALGAMLGEYRQSRRHLVTGLLLFYATFQMLTALVFEFRVVAVAALFSLLCIVAWWFAGVEPQPGSTDPAPAP